MAGSVDMMRGNNIARLTEIAKFAIGSKEATGDERVEISGGAGRIGMINGKVVKFNTHIGERFFGPKADQNMRESCNQLRERLIEITSGMNVSKKTLDAIRRKLGFKEDGRSPADAPLLSRKVVASVINMINDDKGIDIWSNLRIADVEAIASKDLDTTFGTVRAEAKKGAEANSAEAKNGMETMLDVRGLMSADWTEKMLANLVENVQEKAKDSAKYFPFDATCRDMHRGTVIKLGDRKLDSQSLADSDVPTPKNLADTRKEFENYFEKDADFVTFAGMVVNQIAYTSLQGAFTKSLYPSFPVGREDPQQTISLSRQEDGSFLMKTDLAYCPSEFTKDVNDPESHNLTVNPKQSFVKLSCEYKLTRLPGAKKGGNVFNVGDSYFEVSVVPLKTLVDAQIVTFPEEPPEIKMSPLENKQMRCEQHGPMGTKFAAEYATQLANAIAAKRMNNRGFQQVEIDVKRSIDLYFGNKDGDPMRLEKTSEQDVKEEFERHFHGDPNFAVAVACIMNQSAFIAAKDAGLTIGKVRPGANGSVMYSGDHEGANFGHDQLFISAVTGNSVTITGIRKSVPTTVIEGGNLLGRVKNIEPGDCVTESYSFRVTKLGAEDAHAGPNIVQVDTDYFRIDADPLACKVDAQFSYDGDVPGLTNMGGQQAVGGTVG